VKRNALYFHLATLPEMGPVAFGKLTSRYQTLEEILAAPLMELTTDCGFDAQLAWAIHSSEENLHETLELLEILGSIGIETLYPMDEDLPKRLQANNSDWRYLTVFGNVSLLNSDRAIALVGRRQATEEGLSFAHALAAELARRGVVTLSGMAKGIDRAAHLGSLSDGGGTVGLLPMGMLQFLQENRQFPRAAEGEERARLLLVSGAAPNQEWSTAEAMRRNRWIANWSDAVVVVEAGDKGGTWKTARDAKKAGRPLWVAEGFGSDRSGVGNKALRKELDGAALNVNMPIEECANTVIESCG
jgi:DNA processing protein